MRHLMFPTVGRQFREGEPGDEGGPASEPKGSQETKGSQEPKGSQEQPEAIKVDPGEWNRLNAQLRKLQADARKREREAEERAHREEQERLKAAGEFEQAVERERQRAKKMERQLRERNVRDAVLESAAAQGFSAEQARALARLTSMGSIELDDLGEPRPDQVDAAVEATMAQFPNLFKSGGEPGGESEPKPRRRRQSGPATPVRETGAPFEGYVSPEEYANTPRDVRMSAEFRERVAKSEPHWPDKVPANSFATS